MSTLICTVGLPYSGKTYWAKQRGLPIVSPDAIRLALHAQRFEKRAEPMVWSIAEIMVRALFLAGNDRVILDATNNTRKRRERWKSDEWSTEYFVIGTSKEVCLRRAEEADDPVIPDVIERMAQEHEPIQEDE